MDQLQEHWRTVDHGVPKLTDESYSVEGLSHLFGIPRDVILHELSTGEFRTAQPYHPNRQIGRADVHDWLIRRGPGI